MLDDAHCLGMPAEIRTRGEREVLSIAHCVRFNLTREQLADLAASLVRRREHLHKRWLIYSGGKVARAAR